MRSRLALGISLAFIAAPLLSLPVPASAAPCTAAEPATLRLRNISQSRTIAVSAKEPSKQQRRFTYAISGCELPRKPIPVKLIGVDRKAGLQASVQVINRRNAVLLIKLSRQQLDPGKYSMVAVPTVQKVNLAQRFTINARNPAVSAWLPWSIAAAVAGLLVLALRMAGDGGGSWRDLKQFWQPGPLAQAGVGIGGLAGLIYTQVLNNPSWYGTTPQSWQLLIVGIGAVITGGTVMAAVPHKQKESRSRAATTGTQTTPGGARPVTGH